jgi:hypothetical protein
LSDFVKAYEASGLSTRMHYLARGETFSFSLAEMEA